MKILTLARSLRRPCCVAFSVFAAATTPVFAQSSTTTTSSVGDPDDEVIELSPFSVEASEDVGYRAEATLAGSRIRTDLRDVGSAISVVTSEFLRDTGATNNETLLQYTVSTEVSGIHGNFGGMGNTQNLDDTDQRLAPHETTRVRGLGQADNTRDFFLTDIPWDSYNVGRVDMQRGPNAILFGIGSPAGIINASTNAASFEQQGTAEVRFGSYGSARASLDYNHVLLENELSIRVAGLWDETKYRQEPAFNRDKRYYTALRYEPSFLRFDGASTSINVKYESGEITANRPRIIPPGDLITPWWTNPSLAAIREAGGMNPLTLAEGNGPAVDALRAAGDLGAGVRSDNANYFNRAIGSFGRNYGGIVAVFPNPTSGAHHLMTTDIPKVASNALTMPWTIMSGVIPRKDFEGSRQVLDNYDFYRNETLQDRGIFDYYNNLLDGPNKREWSDHEAFNASVAQTFFNNRLGFEAVVDRQNYERGQVNLLSEFGQAITIDMNNHLPNGEVNPNYGKAATISDQFANNAYWSERDAERFTAFGDVRAEDFMGDSRLSKILGRHMFTGLLSEEEHNVEKRDWFRYAADATYGQEVLQSDLLRERGVNTLNYLTSGSIAGLSDLSRANISRIRAVQIPSSGSFDQFLRVPLDGVDLDAPWTNPYGGIETQAQNPASYVGWNGAQRSIGLISDEAGMRNQLTDGASLERSVTSSYAGNWQAYLFDGVLVPSFGFRIDKQKSYALSTGQIPRMPDGSDTIDLTSPNYKLPDTPDDVQKGRSESWSVVLHTPNSWRDKLPWRTGLSLFYNKSENFKPAAGRIDVVGNLIASPQGETEDYGVMISTLNDRLTLRINRYETTVNNDALQGFNGDYMLWGSESWAYSFGRGNLDRVAVGGWADFTEGYNPTGIVAEFEPASGWTNEDIAYAQAVGDVIAQAYMDTRPSAGWYALYGVDTALADQGGFTAGNLPSGFTIPGDTLSQVTEFELTANPVDGWNIAINASKTSAQRINMAGSLVEWVENRWETFNTPVTLNGQPIMVSDERTPQTGDTRQAVIGDLRFWNGGYSPGESLRGKFGREFMGGYNLYRIQEGSDVPELRPWRFNLITNYSFNEGKFKGANIGGGYRWQDGVVVGYPVLPGATIDDPRAFDLDNPYMGPSEDAIDFWVGYSRRLSDKIDWRIQLNIRNVFGDDDLIPITVQPDGTMAAGRIPEPTVWTITNTFRF